LRRKSLRGIHALPRNIAGAKGNDLRVGCIDPTERQNYKNAGDDPANPLARKRNIHGVIPLVGLPVMGRRRACIFAARRAASLTADYRLLI
jgi:hypothetical protein